MSKVVSGGAHKEKRKSADMSVDIGMPSIDHALGTSAGSSNG